MSFFKSKIMALFTLSLSALCLMLVFQNCQGMRANQDQYVLGEYLVRFKDSASSMSVQQINEAEINEEAFGFDLRVDRFISRSSNIALVKTSEDEDPEEVLKALNNHPLIENAEPNYYADLPEEPEPEEGESSLGEEGFIEGEDMYVGKATKDLVVAVLDSGVDYTDPGLKDNMWVNEAEANGMPGVDDDGNGYVDDIHGYDFVNKNGRPMGRDRAFHASRVAGIILAIENVSIMAIKVLPDRGSNDREMTLRGLIEGIDYAVGMKANMINASVALGLNATQSAILQGVIRKAGQSGVLFVASAGNYKSNLDSDYSKAIRQPGFGLFNAPSVITVAAVYRNGELISRYSNYGKKLGSYCSRGGIES